MINWIEQFAASTQSIPSKIHGVLVRIFYVCFLTLMSLACTCVSNIVCVLNIFHISMCTSYVSLCRRVLNSFVELSGQRALLTQPHACSSQFSVTFNARMCSNTSWLRTMRRKLRIDLPSSHIHSLWSSKPVLSKLNWVTCRFVFAFQHQHCKRNITRYCLVLFINTPGSVLVLSTRPTHPTTYTPTDGLSTDKAPTRYSATDYTPTECTPSDYTTTD